jgi:hypothetical protein
MKKQYLILFFLSLIRFVNAQNTEKILFIGNSMTFYNNMPTLFQQIANSKGKNVQTQLYAIGGTGFVDHVNDHNVYDTIASQKWDAVILQPGTGESYGLSFPTSITIERGNRLIDSIRKYSPCAKIILYEISNGIESNSSGSGNYANYFATQTRIKDSITAIAKGMQISFTPAGECFKHHYTSNKDLLLHQSYNDVHPNLNGSYLVACSIFNTLYQENVFPSNYYGGVNDTTALYLQNVSDQVVLNNKPLWLINTYTLNSDFSYIINNMNVQFNNLSINYDSLTWDINGESISNQPSLNYDFQTSGIKTITLTAYKKGCSKSITKQVEILKIHVVDSNSLSVVDINSLDSINIYPNPATDIIFISLNAPIDLVYSIFDFKGRLIIEKKLEKHHKIDVSFLNQGTYLLNIKNNNYNKVIKLIKL